jgi:hypothetical protein
MGNRRATYMCLLLIFRNINIILWFYKWTDNCNILYNVGVLDRFLSPDVQFSGLLDQFWPSILPFYATENTVRIVTSFITIPITRNYIHSQLFLTLLHMYTAYNHLYVRNYNHLFHSYTFTQFTCTTLQSLLHYCTSSLLIHSTRLHWLTSQLSVTFTGYHTLSRTQSLHFTLRNSRRELTPRIHFLRLLLHSHSGNWTLLQLPE